MHAVVFSLKKDAGITLVEILVSVSILAILIALVVPLSGKAREMGAKAGCVANLKKFGQAVHMRAADTGDVLPAKEWVPQAEGPALGGALWRTQLTPYLPIDAKSETCLAETTPYKGYYNGVHYGWNVLSSGSNRPFKSILAIKSLSQMFLIADVKDAAWQILPHDGGGATITPEKTGGFVFRHGNKANLLFMDGHVEARSIEEIPSANQKDQPLYNAFWRGM